jgi:hypothetical protein
MDDYTSRQSASHWLRRKVDVRVIGIAALVLAGLAGCSASGAGNGTHSCWPSYIDRNEFGRISAQQLSRGSGLAWGVFPSVPFVRLVVRVYAGGRKVDGKNQTYAAHGSVPASKIRKAGPGAIFRVEGETYHANGRATSFFLTCRLA